MEIVKALGPQNLLLNIKERYIQCILDESPIIFLINTQTGAYAAARPEIFSLLVREA